jgi:hypothetical protein
MKFLLCLVLLFVPITVFADTMCVRDNTLVLSFGGGEKKLSVGYHVDSAVFWHDYDVGRMYGEATCLSAEESLGRVSGYGAFYGVGEYENTLVSAEKGLRGVDKNGNERKYCWCRLEHPVSSAWVFFRGYNSEKECADSCFGSSWYNCGQALLGSDKSVRAGMFRSVGLK